MEFETIEVASDGLDNGEGRSTNEPFRTILIQYWVRTADGGGGEGVTGDRRMTVTRRKF